MKHEFVLISRHPELYGSVTNTLRKLFGVQAHVKRIGHGARCLCGGIPNNAIVIADADGISGQSFREIISDEVGHRFPVIAIMDEHHPAYNAICRMGICSVIKSAPEGVFRRSLEHAVMDLINLLALQQVEQMIAAGTHSRNPFTSRPPFGAF
ncbi:MAG: hypothetical protein HRU10_14010 [Opitutales bacterium]|nr:hypothetical protein [Opitutales bacterium]